MQHTASVTGELIRYHAYFRLGREWGSIERRRIDARLIAAAPELATELKRATDHIHDLRIVLEQAREMGLTLHMCGVTYDQEKALAVLAKATGGNS
jgi:glycerol dehydrogenase-like iron-containing ADH family enzyme